VGVVRRAAVVMAVVRFVVSGHRCRSWFMPRARVAAFGVVGWGAAGVRPPLEVGSVPRRRDPRWLAVIGSP
jgi:hypothetical protein